MKRHLYALCLVFSVGVWVAGHAWAGESAKEHNRFQLFNAEYRSTFVQKSKTTGFDEKKLFLIDTRTGETWMLIDVMIGEKDQTYWKKINKKAE